MTFNTLHRNNPTQSGEIASGLNGFEVFPNPSTEILSVRYLLSQNIDAVQLKVYDIQGRELLKFRLGDKSPGEYVFQLNTGHLTPGMYICRLETRAVNVQQKFVKVE